DVSTVAPAHDADALVVHVRQRSQVVHRAHDVVDLVAAVVDGHIVRFAIPGAPPVLGADDDVAPFHGLPDEREHGDVPVPVDAAVHPDHGGVSARPSPVQRLEEIGGDVHVADAAAVGDLLEIHDATAAFGVLRVDLRLCRVICAVIAAGSIGRIATYVHSPGPE